MVLLIISYITARQTSSLGFPESRQSAGLEVFAIVLISATKQSGRELARQSSRSRTNLPLSALGPRARLAQVSFSLTLQSLADECHAFASTPRQSEVWSLTELARGNFSRQVGLQTFNSGLVSTLDAQLFTLH